MRNDLPPTVMSASWCSCSLRCLVNQGVEIGIADPWVYRRMLELCLIAREGTTVLERPRRKREPKLRKCFLFIFVAFKSWGPSCERGYYVERLRSKLLLSSLYFSYSIRNSMDVFLNFTRIWVYSMRGCEQFYNVLGTLFGIMQFLH